MFSLILSGLSAIQTLGAYEIGEDLDQTQGEENYGYWFDDTAIRWQEFRPLYSTLTRLDLNVDKNGNPGNILVNITDGLKSLWNTTVLEADIASGAIWVNISLESALPLIPEQSYYIYVRSDIDSTSPSNRYVWDGHLNSNYTRGISSITSAPDFDFTFVTWSLSNDREIYLDQIQNSHTYGFLFDANGFRWQEFKPLYSTLTRLDLYIVKNGNPGNLLVNISDGERTLWHTTVLEADIVLPWGWLNISINPALPLIPERSYFIYVNSDTNSTTTDKYFWDGSTNSNYYRGTNSVAAGWPTFDFAFRTWSIPSDPATYLDQAQEDVNYGFVFSDSWNAWQEFKPVFSTLTQLDLNIQRTGDPGDVLVNITDGQATIWNTTILEAEIPAPGGWVSISFPSTLPLIPGNSYYIYVRSVDPHVPGTHYYAWMGHITSSYTFGDTNVQSGWPTYDYAFRVWTQSSDISLFLDQVQEEEDYGYWFDDTVIRWQEFKPFYPTLTQIDLNIQKSGNPGNMLVNITDGQKTIWQTLLSEADITGGWVIIPTNLTIPLIPDQSYYIYVGSDTDSASASNRYFWDGHLNSNYTRGISSITSAPDFDFTFRTVSLVCDRSVYLDQAQDGLNYGYWFEETVIQWQEFVPLYANLTQIDLYLQKNGNPGNVLVNITDGQNTLWQTTVLEADSVTGWVPILVPSSLSLIPGQSYFIYVWSDSPSPNVDNRYFWRGYSGSNYYRGVSSSPLLDFDFEFRTWGQFFDPISPEIVIISPTNSSYAESNIWLNFSINEPTSWIGYSLDGSANGTIIENTLLGSLSEGSHRVVLYATDLVGNTGESSTVWFTVDTLAPSIILTNPTNSTTYNMTDIWLNFTIDEPTSWIGYSLDRSINVTITGNTLLESLSEGSHRIVLYASDLMGNTGKSIVIWFTVEIPEPESSGPTTTIPPTTTKPTTTEPESTSTTTSEQPNVSPGFSYLIVGSTMLLILVFLRRRR
ncbi:MAG: hypothetical protein ACFFB5_09545 [Promethearchaeota archaeon]